MAEKLNMEISLNKSKCLVVPKRNIKCEIRIKITLLDQVSTFNYLGVEISAKRDLKQEVKNQATKAARISGCLYNLVWNNKYMPAEAKTHVYKTSVRPVLTYAADTRAETTPTQQILRTTEIKIIRAIHGKTPRDKIRSEHVQQLNGIQEMDKRQKGRMEQPCE